MEEADLYLMINQGGTATLNRSSNMVAAPALTNSVGPAYPGRPPISTRAATRRVTSVRTSPRRAGQRLSTNG